ncbi:hypothetical protein ABIE26_000745 [Pedobacter africanus]
MSYDYWKKSFKMNFEKIIENIKSKDDFTAFVGILMQDFQNNVGEWENRTVDTYLEAIQRYTEDLDGYFRNQNVPVPENVPWKVFAVILVAAKMYE